MPLKLLIWNVQDFFVFLDKYNHDKALTEYTEPYWQQLSSSLIPNKPLDKVLAIADLIKSLDIDLCFMTEVAGHESLSNFNQYFLDEKFKVHHFPSNSDRGIDVGVLIQKKIKNIASSFHNHSDFARGLQQITLKYNLKKYHFFLTHLKSKLNKQGKDFEGRTQREKEVNRIIKIIKKLPPKERERSMVCGDFNGIIYKDQTEEELKSFDHKLNFKDAFEILNHDLFERSTYCYFDKQKELNPMQLDYALLGSELAQYLGNNSAVLDFDGKKRTDFPITREEKFRLPSDHYPIYIELQLK